MKAIIVIMIVLDLFILIIVLLSGLISQYTLKVSHYKYHSLVILASMFSILPNLFVSTLNFGFFVLRIASFLHCRRLLTFTYAVLLSTTFEQVQDTSVRQKLYELFYNGIYLYLRFKYFNDILM